VWSVSARLVALAVLAVMGTTTLTAAGSPVREQSGRRVQSGYSLSLNGSSAYISVPDARSLQLERTNAFTVVLRARLRSTSNNLLPRFWEKGPHYLCVMGDSSNPRFREVALEVQNASGGGNTNGGATEYWGDTRLQTNRWYVLAVTFDASRRSKQAQIYVDGVPEAMTTIYPWSGTLFATAGKPWVIGRRTRDLARQLDGLVDWLVVYPSVLAPAQIAAIGNGSRPAGASADWEFDEGSGTTAYDSSQHRNDGAIVDGSYAAN